MPKQPAPIRVPSDLAADVEEIANAIKDAAQAQGQLPEDLMLLTRAKTKDMVGGGEVDTLFLILGSGAVWFTKKWFDTFVWPTLEHAIRKPSEKAVDFVFANFSVVKKET